MANAVGVIVAGVSLVQESEAGAWWACVVVFGFWGILIGLEHGKHQFVLAELRPKVKIPRP
jgi:hypothetical protein